MRAVIDAAREAKLLQ
nr:hypothetical protein [Mesorhizobium sp. M7A.F.Ca.US.005.03.2.1]